MSEWQGHITLKINLKKHKINTKKDILCGGYLSSQRKQQATEFSWKVVYTEYSLWNFYLSSQLQYELKEFYNKVVSIKKIQ